MAQQDGSTATTRGQPALQTEDLEDDEVNLLNLDINNSGEIVTSTATLDSDVINNSNVMDNTAADFLPQQYIPTQHRHDRPVPDRGLQPSQPQVADVQRNPIHNPLRTPTLPPKNLHNHVDPKINFRAQTSQDKEFLESQFIDVTIIYSLRQIFHHCLIGFNRSHNKILS